MGSRIRHSAPKEQGMCFFAGNNLFIFERRLTDKSHYCRLSVTAFWRWVSKHLHKRYVAVFWSKIFPNGRKRILGALGGHREIHHISRQSTGMSVEYLQFFFFRLLTASTYVPKPSATSPITSGLQRKGFRIEKTTERVLRICCWYST